MFYTCLWLHLSVHVCKHARIVKSLQKGGGVEGNFLFAGDIEIYACYVVITLYDHHKEVRLFNRERPNFNNFAT